MTDQTTETRVAEIEKRAEKATEGPWEWSGAGGEYYGLTSLKGKDVLEVHDGIVYSEYSSDPATVSCGYEDSLFIPHAREDIPWLLSQLRAAWKREAALRAAMKIASEWAERVSLGTDATPRIVGAMALIQAATKEANNE